MKPFFKINFIAYTFLLFLSNSSSFSQSGDVIRSVVPYPDGGYIIFGLTHDFGLNSPPSGTNIQDYFIIRTDSNFKIQYFKTIGRSKDEGGDEQSLHIARNGDLIIASATEENDFGSWDAFAGRYTPDSASFTEKWAKVFARNTNFGDGFVGCVEDTNSNLYLFGGSSSATNDQDFFLVKLNSSGNTLWKKIYSSPCWEKSNFILKTNDGNLLLLGVKSDGTQCNPASDNSYDVLIMKIDTAGSIQWSKIFRTPKCDYSYSILETSYNDYFIVGFSNNFSVSGFEGMVIRMGSSGNIKWVKTYSKPNTSITFSNVTLTNDSEGILAAGTLTDYGNPNTNKKDLIVIKMDTSGAVQWASQFGNDTLNEDMSKTYGICPTTNKKGYLLAGSIPDFSSTNLDVFLVQFNEDGKSGGYAKDITDSIIIEDKTDSIIVNDFPTGTTTGGSEKFVSNTIINYDSVVLAVFKAEALDTNYSVDDSVITVFKDEYLVTVTKLDSFRIKVCFKFDSTLFNTPKSEIIKDLKLVFKPDTIDSLILHTDSTTFSGNEVCFYTNHFSNWAIALTKPQARKNKVSLLSNPRITPFDTLIRYQDGKIEFDALLRPQSDTLQYFINQFDINPGGTLPANISTMLKSVWESKSDLFDSAGIYFNPSGIAGYDSTKKQKYVMLFRNTGGKNWRKLNTYGVMRNGNEMLYVSTDLSEGHFVIALDTNANHDYFSASINVQKYCSQDSAIFSTTLNGGYSPFSYRWKMGDSIISTNSTANFATPSGSITYQLEVSDSLRAKAIITTTLSDTITCTTVNQNANCKIESQIGLIPNPAQNELLIHSANENKYSIRFTNLLGQTIFDEELTGTQNIDISLWNKGLYFVIIENKTISKKQILKFLVQ